MGNINDTPVIGQETIDENLGVVTPHVPTKIDAGRARAVYQPSAVDMKNANIDAAKGRSSSLQGLTEDQLEHLNPGGGTMRGNDVLNMDQLHDTMANNQGSLEAAGRSITKFGAKVGINMTGGILGTVYGIEEWARTGDFSKVYDNDITEGLDVLNKYMDDEFGVYKTQDYKDGNFLNKMTSPFMFVDEFGDSLAFTVAAIGTEFLTGGLASFGIAAMVAGKFGVKALSKLDKLADLAGVTAKTAKTLSRAKYGAIPGKYLTGARQIFLTGSAWEAGVETRQAMAELKVNLAKKGLSEEEINTISEDAEKWMFFGNLAIVNISQIAQFPSLFSGPASWAGKNTANEGVKAFLKRQGSKITTKHMSDPAIMAKGALRAIKNPLVEGVWEEGTQGVLSKTVGAMYGQNMYVGDSGALNWLTAAIWNHSRFK